MSRSQRFNPILQQHPLRNNNMNDCFFQIFAAFLLVATRLAVTEAFQCASPATGTTQTNFCMKKGGLETPYGNTIVLQRFKRRDFLQQTWILPISAAAFVPKSPANAANLVVSPATPSPPPTITSLADLEPYEVRQKQIGMASKRQVLETLKKDPRAMILDVRRDEEIAKLSLRGHRRTFVHAACGLKECGELKAMAETILPDKKGTYAIIYRKLTFDIYHL